MAREAVKKLKAKNEKVLTNLKMQIAGVTVLYLVIRFVLLFSSFGFWNLVMAVFFCLVYLLCYTQLQNAAKCTYDENNDIVSAGQDISMGWWEYMYDVLYITMFVQIGSLYSNKFFWLFLAIPLYALWAARSMFGMMSQFAPQQQAREDDGGGKGKKAAAGDRNARFLSSRKK